ncbi:MAG TPA: dTDP-4-dehydrorhamnose reductase, partial [Methylomirabilota bacterium]|nr:dTDP-4-dehydrorhamnose reductase [Methylomirabilota bacterium]
RRCANGSTPANGSAWLRNRAMRILVTGFSGQVATALRLAARPGLDIVALGRPALDLTDPAGVESAIAALRPDAIISAAAYTAVDAAETDAPAAFAVNAAGPGHVGRAAAAIGAPVVHISTDYVFSGDARTPYGESDKPAPLGVYGATKLEGERRVLAAQPRGAVLRTSWVYSPYGANFVRTMIALAERQDEVRVVADQHGAPTSAEDIAEGCLAVVRNLFDRPGDRALTGVFHMAASGSASWADVAEAVFEGCARHGRFAPRVQPIATADYPRPARRPRNSRLDCSRLAAVHGVSLPPWRASLDRMLDAMLAPASPGAPRPVGTVTEASA